MPASCDWYGASGLGRLEVQVATGEAVLVGLLLLGLWWRQVRPAGRSRRALAGVPLALAGVPLALAGVPLALAGLVVGVAGTADEAGPLLPLGLGMFGAGAVLSGLAVRSAGRGAFGWLTVALGAFALLGAVDRGLTMLPYLPVPPSLVRILIEVVWVPWAAAALVERRSRPEATGPTTQAPEQPEPVREPTG
jgi:hypothetical protein